MRGRAAGRLGRRTELIELRAKVGELLTAERLLERELAEVKAERDHWRALADAERQRVDVLLERLAERLAEQQPKPARRRWWRWWRRSPTC